MLHSNWALVLAMEVPLHQRGAHLASGLGHDILCDWSEEPQCPTPFIQPESAL